MAKNFKDRIKTKWDIKTDRDFWLIMLVFSIAGMGVSFGRKKIFALLGLTHAPIGTQILISLLLIVPLYQLSTLFFGLLFGQFNFFWGRQKIYGKHLKRAFSHAWVMLLSLFQQ